MDNGHVMIVYNCLDVLHAAITDFNFISVEYLVKGVALLVIGTYKVQESLAYTSCDTFTVWWVKLHNARLAIFVFIFLNTCAWGVVN